MTGKAEQAVRREGAFGRLRRGYAEFMTSLGVAGSAITVLSNLSDLINLAAWAEYLVERWRGWAALFWNLLAGLIDLSVPQEAATILTFVVFILFASLGARMAGGSAGIGPWGVFGRLLLLGLAVLFIIVFFAFILFVSAGSGAGQNGVGILVAMISVYISCVAVVWTLSRRNNDGAARNTWLALLAGSGLAAIFTLNFLSFILDPGPKGEETIAFLVKTILIFGFLSGLAIAIPLIMAPHRTLYRRYLYIYGAVGAVLALSEASKLSKSLMG